MQTIAKEQIKSSIRRKMYDEYRKRGDAVKFLVFLPLYSQRPLKTGLAYKYKITLKRGNLKTYPSEILQDVFNS